MNPPLVEIADLGRHAGETVTLRGWLCGRRFGGGIAFLHLRDGTGVCQCVVEAAAAEAFAAAAALTLESALSVTGAARADDRAPGGYELTVRDLALIHAAPPYPIARKEHGVDFLMSHRHLWLRSRRPVAVLRVRDTLVRACRAFFEARGFTLVDTPILVPGAGEDASTLFPVEYFDRRLFLAQTGQLYLESACMALGKVYAFGPTFRAEKSKTRRHLTEFWMIEPEVAFAELDDVIELAEDLVCCVVERVLREREPELRVLGRDPERLRAVRKPFPRLTYSEAAERLRSPGLLKTLEDEFQRDRSRLAAWMAELEELERRLRGLSRPAARERIERQIAERREEIAELEQDLSNRPGHIASAQSFAWGSDLGGSDETILSRQFDRPVFVTHYPVRAKAFYMKQCAEDPRLVLNMDLLAPEGYGEIVGGSQREDNLDVLLRRMTEKGLRPEDYDWYLDLRRYGSVPHGGFGLGIERTLTWLCGLRHVRETIPFPRTRGRVYP
ncbi:MAG: asparagine--tRNA ligase [Lentisphaerae bacterium]|nr:asparagine--tRNA ligase [Lentisphaerota bacterium]